MKASLRLHYKFLLSIPYADINNTVRKSGRRNYIALYDLGICDQLFSISIRDALNVFVGGGPCSAEDRVHTELTKIAGPECFDHLNWVKDIRV